MGRRSNYIPILYSYHRAIGVSTICQQTTLENFRFVHLDFGKLWPSQAKLLYAISFPREIFSAYVFTDKNNKAVAYDLCTS